MMLVTQGAVFGALGCYQRFQKLILKTFRSKKKTKIIYLTITIFRNKFPNPRMPQIDSKTLLFVSDIFYVNIDVVVVLNFLKRDFDI